MRNCLLLGMVSALVSQQDFYIKHLPKAVPEVDSLNMYSGHLLIDQQRNANMFFWLVEAKYHQDPTDTLLIWFNGGPGCSSMDGMFLENGPLRFKDDKVVLNPYSWHQRANILYLDQPVGTGFSYSNRLGYAHNEDMVGKDVVSFLIEFFKVFPQLSKNKMMLAGESYAGTYIPHIGKAIVESNNKDFKLSGLIIGNGWIDPKNQYKAYLDYAKANNLVHGNNLQLAEQSLQNCMKIYDNGSNRIKEDSCERILDYILQETKRIGKCLNMYDIRYHDDKPGDGCGLYKWPPGLSDVTAYLGDDAVKEAIHATNYPGKWRECDDAVGDALDNDPSLPSYKLLPDLLSKIPILLFSGDKDLICNWMGTQSLIDELEWNGQKGMSDKALKQDWYLGDNLAGTIQYDRSLTFVIVHNASHMVPVDSGLEAEDMFYRFIQANQSAMFINSTLTRKGEKPIYPHQGQQIIPTDLPTTIPITNVSKHNTNYGGWIALTVIVFGLVVCGLVYWNLKNKPKKARMA